MNHPLPYSDTDPQILEKWYELLRGMSVEDKLTRVFELTSMALAMAERGVRMRHPNASDREVFLRTAALHLSRDEMIRAYGWDPREHDEPGCGI